MKEKIQLPKLENVINVIDCHTAGEPARIIIDGLPDIKGDTMAEKRDYFKNEMDHFRRFLILEPRGHSDMFGAVLTTPCNPLADIGILFMDTDGYLNMCGHGTIAAVTVLLETGIVKKNEPFTEVNIDAPAGLIKTRAKIENGKVIEVSFENVPAFLYMESVKIPFENKEISIDISFGGSFFALTSARDLGLEICPQNINKFVEIGMKLLNIINNTVKVQHPTLKAINSVDLVEFYEDKQSEENFKYAKNIVVFGNGQYDRSPCGTGTCAKIASMISKNKLELNQLFVNESVLGTKFKGQASEKCKVGNFDAIIPGITGSAYITGIQQLVHYPEDPFKFGFNLKVS